jgi:hypothetical protein
VSPYFGFEFFDGCAEKRDAAAAIYVIYRVALSRFAFVVRVISPAGTFHFDAQEPATRADADQIRRLPVTVNFRRIVAEPEPDVAMFFARNARIIPPQREPEFERPENHAGLCGGFTGHGQ